ncbi:hypothetical protein Pcinc_042832, partial [Petrolisthes cinctipes]
IDYTANRQMEFPDVIICNQNRLSCYKLLEFMLKDLSARASSSSSDDESDYDNALVNFYLISGCGEKGLNCKKVTRGVYYRYYSQANESIPSVLIEKDKCLQCKDISEAYEQFCSEPGMDEKSQVDPELDFLWQYLNCYEKLRQDAIMGVGDGGGDEVSMIQRSLDTCKPSFPSQAGPPMERDSPTVSPATSTNNGVAVVSSTVASLTVNRGIVTSSDRPVLSVGVSGSSVSTSDDVSPGPVPLLPNLISSMTGRVSSTTGPVSSTGDPVSSTTGPVSSTGGPVSSTGGPVSSTTGPVSSTTAPVSSTGGPVSSTTGPVSSTTAPVSSTGGPVSSTTGPVSSTGGPISSTGGPVSSTGGPVSSTDGPVSSTGGPVSSTTGPVSSTTGPVSSTGGLTVTSTSSTSSLTTSDLEVTTNDRDGAIREQQQVPPSEALKRQKRFSIVKPHDDDDDTPRRRLEAMNPSERSDLKMDILSRYMELPFSIRKALGYSFNELILDCVFMGLNCTDSSFFSYFFHPTHGNCYIFRGGKEASITGPIFGLSLVANVYQFTYLPGMLTEKSRSEGGDPKPKQSLHYARGGLRCDPRQQLRLIRQEGIDFKCINETTYYAHDPTKANCGCNLACNDAEYPVTSTTTAWPPENIKNQVHADYKPPESVDDDLLHFRVSFSTLVTESIIQKEIYSTPFDLITNLGGTLSIYLGISLILIAEIVELLLFLIINSCKYALGRYQPRKQQQQQQQQQKESQHKESQRTGLPLQYTPPSEQVAGKMLADLLYMKNAKEMSKLLTLLNAPGPESKTPPYTINDDLHPHQPQLTPVEEDANKSLRSYMFDGIFKH